ncbi:acyl carrier protein [Streptomyces sp. WSLK1-5]|uniref:acyl carrier protein n=1 Tax=unclassified Streptomyces TaxID=2593676 RepID=UPI00379D8E72
MSTETAAVGDDPLATLLDLSYEVLGLRCDPNRSFFDYGDSMAATQMCTLGRNRHGWKITARDVFAWDSFVLLAGAIQRDGAR